MLTLSMSLSLLIIYLFFLYISARRHVMTTWTSPCVHCVMECATTGVWVRCAHWPERHTCSTTEPLSCSLFSCLCGVTIHSFTLSWSSYSEKAWTKCIPFVNPCCLVAERVQGKRTCLAEYVGPVYLNNWSKICLSPNLWPWPWRWNPCCV